MCQSGSSIGRLTSHCSKIASPTRRFRRSALRGTHVVSNGRSSPQDRYVAAWAPARQAWSFGTRVGKLIGYDASPQDSRRYAHAEGIRSPLYDYRYPLREWGWDRMACAMRIRQAGLPVLVKSSCFFCGAITVAEVLTLPAWCLRLIVLMEARAAPRLRTIDGVWRKPTRERPGSMTEFIRERGLLAPAEIDHIIEHTPLDLIRFQEVAAGMPIEQRPALPVWLDEFSEGVARLGA
jgi:hypothetical protein